MLMLDSVTLGNIVFGIIVKFSGHKNGDCRCRIFIGVTLPSKEWDANLSLSNLQNLHFSTWFKEEN